MILSFWQYRNENDDPQIIVHSLQLCEFDRDFRRYPGIVVGQLEIAGKRIAAGNVFDRREKERRRSFAADAFFFCRVNPFPLTLPDEFPFRLGNIAEQL